MKASNIPEQRRRAWAFAVITILWIGASIAIVWHLMPSPDRDTAALRAALARNTALMDEEALLLESYLDLSREVRTTQFQVYQMYVVSELRDKAKALHLPNTPIEAHSSRVSQLLNLLINVREELVAKQRNLIRIGNQVQNCREGNQDIQMN